MEVERDTKRVVHREKGTEKERKTDGDTKRGIHREKATEREGGRVRQGEGEREREKDKHWRAAAQVYGAPPPPLRPGVTP